MRRPTIIMILAVLSIEEGIAQKNQDPITQIESVTLRIVEEVTKLSEEIDSFSSRVKAKRIDRELGYMQSDLFEYLAVRRQLTEKLEEIEYNLNSKKGKKLAFVETKGLRLEMMNIERRLEVVIYHVKSGLADEIDEANLALDRAYNSQLIYLNILSDTSKGGEEALKKSGREILIQLEESVLLIDSMRTILQKKFDF